MSEPGLTEEQQRVEEAWIDEFNRASNSLEWAQWEKFWDTDAFLQWCGNPKLEGREAIARHLQEKSGMLSQFKHVRIIRRSFDVPRGLIYQTSLLSYQVKGDPEARTIERQGLSVFHKEIGSNTITGFEIYIDQEPVLSVAREIRAMSGLDEDGLRQTH